MKSKLFSITIFLMMFFCLCVSGVNIGNTEGTNVSIEPYFAHLQLADPSIVAYYPLDNTAYGTVAQTYDYSNNNNDGNLTGYTFNHGLRNNAQTDSKFNGITQTVSFTIPTNSNVTISLWYKNSTESTYTHVVRINNLSNYTNGITGNSFNYPVNITSTFVILGNSSEQGYFNGSITSFSIFNKTLNITEITAIYNAGMCAVSPVGDKLVVQYILCNQSDMNSESLPYWQGSYSNSTHVFDTNNQVEGRTGKGSVAELFNGLTTHNKIHNKSLDFAVNYTISIYINPYYLSGGKAIFGKNGVTLLRANGNKVDVVIWNTSNSAKTLSTTTSDIPLKSFSNIILVFNITHTMIYFNGQLQDTDAVTGGVMVGSSELRIGELGTSFWNGSISNVIIFNRSLSATEVAQLYTGTFPLYKTSGFLNYTDTYLSASSTVLSLINVSLNHSVNTLGLQTDNNEYVAFSNYQVNNYALDLFPENVKIIFTPNSYYSTTPILYSSYNVNNFTCTLNMSEGQTGNTCPITISGTNLVKTITSNLNNIVVVNASFLTSLCPGNSKDNFGHVTITNSIVNSYSCDNTFVNVEIILYPGVTTLTIVRQNAAMMNDWIETFSGMFALLVVVVLLVVAMSFLIPLYNGKEVDIDILKIVWVLVLSSILFGAAVVIFSSMGI